MEELVDLIASEASPSDVSDRIKDVLYAKSAERLDALKPHVANAVFADEVIDDEESTEQEE
jgi:hypothetical protein|tara:strand:- start:640 stop:822 length:183 start_codon:yes stop_codon:yes gene_type:complete